MSLFLKLVALFRIAFPLPAWTDKTTVTEWLENMAPAIADLLASFLTQYQTTGSAELSLPTGATISIFEGLDGKPTMTADHAGMLCEACCASLTSEADELPEKIGDGKILEMLMKLMPLILQILPLFLATPAPKPEPPAPGPVTV